MNLHEYQSKELLKKRGAPVLPGQVAETPEQVGQILQELSSQWQGPWVIKSQIHAGGRGKGHFRDGFRGGIHLVHKVDKAIEVAKRMLGNTLITAQTGPAGRVVRKVLVEAAPKVLKEFYVAVLLDRSRAVPMIMVSSQGGVEIEQVAKEHPETIHREWIDPGMGFQPYQGRKLAKALGLSGKRILQAAQLLGTLYRTWVECDASLVEINPLGLVEWPGEGERLVVLDAKMKLEDNGLARHPDLAALRDWSQESPLEVEATQLGLNYIKLDGDIACLVNGAGLAMATMDMIQHFGGEPANFLDIGGGASVDQVAGALRIILKDPGVRAILVNIFGGIMECDVIARGIVQAARETSFHLPLVVRLEGTNMEEGRRILEESGLPIQSASSLDEAAQKVIQAARG